MPIEIILKKTGWPSLKPVILLEVIYRVCQMRTQEAYIVL